MKTKITVCVLIAAIAVLTMTGCGALGQTVSGLLEGSLPEISGLDVFGAQSSQTAASDTTSAPAESSKFTFSDFTSAANERISSLANELGLDIQTQSGQTVITGSEGNRAQMGGELPDNEFTAVIAPIDFGTLLFSAENDNSFSFAMSGVTVQQVREYCGQLKAMGYDTDVAENSMSALGLDTYDFSASDSQGRHVKITVAVGVMYGDDTVD